MNHEKEDLNVTLDEATKDVYILAGKTLSRNGKDSNPAKSAIWFAMTLKLHLFSAAQLYNSLTLAEILFVCFLGILCYLLPWAMQDIGIKYGVPFQSFSELHLTYCS